MKNQKAGNPVIFLFSRCWKYSEGNRKAVVLYWALFIAAGIINLVVGPVSFAKIVEIIQRDNQITQANIGSLIFWLVLMVTSTVVFWSLHGPARVIERNNAFRAKINYRQYLVGGTLELPLSWHRNNHSGYIIDKIEKGIRALHEFSDVGFDLIYLMVKLIGSLIMLAYFFPVSVAIALGMLVLAFITVSKFDKTLMSQQKTLSANENEVSQEIVDAMANITTVITLRVEHSFFKSIMQRSWKPFLLFKQYNKLNEWKWFMMNVFCILTVTIAIGLFLRQHIGFFAGAILSQFVLLFSYLEKITDIFNRIAYSYGKFITQQIQILNAEELAKNFRNRHTFEHVLPKTWNRVIIKNLTFSYPGNEWHRSHIDELVIYHGQNIAIVGQTGSGKSTFLSIMRNHESPESAALYIDNQHIPEGFAGIEQGLLLMPQSPEVFADTILKNLTLGLVYSQSAIDEALRISRFDEVLKTLPDGLETRLGEDGLTLSGGERQRLALARGILAITGKDIVLLDEPTSSLDKDTELRIYKSIIEKCAGKTLVCCTHNLNLLSLFDRVLVFEKGRLVGDGTEAELVETCPEFCRLSQRLITA